MPKKGDFDDNFLNVNCDTCADFFHSMDEQAVLPTLVALPLREHFWHLKEFLRSNHLEPGILTWIVAVFPTNIFVIINNLENIFTKLN